MDNSPTLGIINLVDVVNLAIALALVFAAAASVWFMFVGGIGFILSGGKEDKMKSSLDTIRYALIGLVITVGAVVFMFILGNLFDVNLSPYINFDRMFELLAHYFNKVVDGPNSGEILG